MRFGGYSCVGFHNDLSKNHTVSAVQRRSHPADREARSAPARVHEYADDKHIHGSCRPMETQSLMERLGTCISDVAGWISSNCLQLNTAKNRSTLVRFLSPAAPHPECPLRVCADNIKPGKYVCDVEIYIDSDMSMKAHVSRTVSRCFASLRHIRSIRLSPF